MVALTNSSLPRSPRLNVCRVTRRPLRDLHHVRQSGPDEIGQAIKGISEFFAAPSALPEILSDPGDLPSCLPEQIFEMFPILDTALTFNHGMQGNGWRGPESQQVLEAR